MKVFTASLATETNTFAPCPTGMRGFQEVFYPAGTHPSEVTLFSGPLAALREKSAELNLQVIEGLVTAAQPSGTTTRRTYESLRDQILDDLKAAGEVQLVLLGLHGAMVADGYDDCEGDLLARVREIVGSNTVIGATTDPHCHLTPLMIEQADVLVIWKEYPHTDILERAHELIDLCVGKATGRLNPIAAMIDCQMITMIHTTREPGLSLVKRLKSCEGQNSILSVSVAHGFPWGDVPEMGTKVLVYANDDAPKAQALARQLADEVIAMRDDLQIDFADIDSALDQALAERKGPVVISDGADNPGGGAASDSTFFIRRMIERNIKSAAVGPVWDPVAVNIATDAGLGARLELRVGGKIGPLSGDPIDLHCTVKGLATDLKMTGMAEGTSIDCGDCALIEVDGLEIVLFSLRNQAMGTDMFTQLGCDLQTKQVIVVKSSQHFYAHFSKVASKVIYATAPGTVTLDLNMLNYEKIRRPKWPLT
ncbi:MAG: M81 family metallopeptidase [Burkholderiaceae bacterium]